MINEKQKWDVLMADKHFLSSFPIANAVWIIVCYVDNGKEHGLEWNLIR